MSKLTPQQILAIPFVSNDLGGTVTIRAYLTNLLQALWCEKEMFSGKKPFGNSDWDSDVAVALIKAKVVRGKLDPNGYIEKVKWGDVDRVMAEAIEGRARAFPPRISRGAPEGGVRRRHRAGGVEADHHA